MQPASATSLRWPPLSALMGSEKSESSRPSERIRLRASPSTPEPPSASKRASNCSWRCSTCSMRRMSDVTSGLASSVSQAASCASISARSGRAVRMRSIGVRSSPGMCCAQEGDAQATLARDIAGVAVIQPGEDAQESGLARAVRADQANARLVADGEVEVGEHGAPAVGFGDAVQSDQNHCDALLVEAGRNGARRRRVRQVRKSGPGPVPALAAAASVRGCIPSEMFGRSTEPSELQMGAVRQGPQRIAALDHPIAVLVARWMHGVSLSSMVALHCAAEERTTMARDPSMSGALLALKSRSRERRD